ncbi:putative Mitochondrial carrier protein [Trypanosoma vivax]|uniref:Putative acetyltransferase n=1 Tax=Trypanosoma vivax (strain Y486) TaxID=1055687 RepID=G0U444_TRYVY|nr:putative acetyltransferase [Trypanosoma vivax]KAH8611193.1 putative Mitochondrial carrier protein [Trypanosoma vivax]CCC52206.1 putative acetyltransferase [Trypanosoma vivax Y486]
MPADVKALIDAPLSKMCTVTISGFSGMFAWVFTHPFEMWKNIVMTSPKGTSQRECLARMWRQGPFSGLASGLLRQIVYAPSRLGFYPIFRDALSNLKSNPGDPLTITDRAIAGALSGAFASVLSSPVEVCLVLQTTSKSKLSLLGAVSCVYHNGGIIGYWRGAGALASRAALVGVAQVGVHDQVLTFLRQRNARYSLKNNVNPFNDNIVVNVASVITALFYSIVTMPVEVARVRMSAEGSKSKYKNLCQTILCVAREEGVLSMYDSFFPYFVRCAMHTVVCFFTIEYLTRGIKTWRATKLPGA